MEITPEQIRAARALLRLEQAEVARRAQVSVVTIRRIEGAGAGGVAPATLDGIRLVLEEAGAEFIPNGVRSRRNPQREAHQLFEDLRAISLTSAARLQGRDMLTDADLYDEDGLPR